MRCPQCGLQNAPGSAQCIRCATPFPDTEQARRTPPPQQPPVRPRPAGSAARPAGQPQAAGPPSGWQHPGYAPRQVQPVEPHPRAETGKALRIAAAVAMALAALAALAYGGWALTARRAIFADLAEGGVTVEDAETSDRLDAALLGTTVTVLVVALILWVLARLRSRRPFGTAGFTALAMFGVGVLVVLAGVYVTSLVDGDVARADTAAIGFLVVGLGFLILAGGAVSALVAVLAKRRTPRVPEAGFAGWRRP